MASSIIKTLTKDISGSVTFNSPVTSAFYKDITITGKLLHISFEVFVNMTDLSPNTWFDIGMISLPTGVLIPYEKYIDFIGTNANFQPVTTGLLRVRQNKLQMLIDNTDANYMFVNGVIKLN